LHLDAEITPVDIVAQEEILCRGWRSTNLKQLQQIKILAMDITADWKTIAIYLTP